MGKNLKYRLTWKKEKQEQDQRASEHDKDEKGVDTDGFPDGVEDEAEQEVAEPVGTSDNGVGFQTSGRVERFGNKGPHDHF